jgi:hypothetical protein
MRSDFKWKVAVTLLAVALIQCGTTCARADLLIVNGGFETPHLGSGYQYDPSGAGVGWDFGGGLLGDSGISGNNSNFTIGNPLAPEGTQVAFLQNAGSVFSQTIDGFTGDAYTVAFFAAQRGGGGGTLPSVQDFAVAIDGIVIGTFLPTGTTYTEFTTAPFIVAAGSHTLSFTGLNTAGAFDVTAFVDDVRIRARTVPEPTSFTMLGLGALGVLLYRRHRHRPNRA